MNVNLNQLQHVNVNLNQLQLVNVNVNLNLNVNVNQLQLVTVNLNVNLNQLLDQLQLVNVNVNVNLNQLLNLYPVPARHRAIPPIRTTSAPRELDTPSKARPLPENPALRARCSPARPARTRRPARARGR